MVVDQLTKTVVRAGMNICSAPPVSLCDHRGLFGPIGLLRTENAGSAFGLIDGNWGLLALLLLALSIMAGELKALSISRWMIVSVALQMGGLLANLADRLLHGAVTDFIDLRIGMAEKGLVLNPADIALAIGGAMFFLALHRRLDRASRQNVLGGRASASRAAIR
jgi:signal peptidase II